MIDVKDRSPPLRHAHGATKEAGMSELQSIVLVAATGALVVFAVALIAARNYLNRIPPKRK